MIDDVKATASGGKTTKNLIIYRLYFGLVLATGAWFGAFRGWSSPPVNANLNPRKGVHP
jgi:hypothetical protein